MTTKRAETADTAATNGHVTIDQEVITPEIAAAWLEEKNAGNRNVRQERVDRYAADMAAGRWLLTSESIKFDTSGELFDGQHRLWACIQAGVPFVTVVARGVSPDTKLVIDTGAARRLGDYFKITAEKNAPLLAGIVNICWRYERDGWVANSTPSHAQAAEWLAERPEVRNATLIAVRVRKEIGAPPSPIGAAYALNAEIDADAAEAFWQEVYTGAGLEAGSAVLALRRWATLQLARRERPNTRTWFFTSLKAMNLWRAGRSVRVLAWRADEGPPRLWTPRERGA